MLFWKDYTEVHHGTGSETVSFRAAVISKYNNNNKKT